MRQFFIREIGADERAQATIEYVLILAIVITLFMIVAKQLILPTYSKLNDAISRRLKNAIFSGDLHRIHLGR